MTTGLALWSYARHILFDSQHWMNRGAVAIDQPPFQLHATPIAVSEILVPECMLRTPYSFLDKIMRHELFQPGSHKFVKSLANYGKV